MTTRYSFTCLACGKKFKIQGHWYNQALMEWYLYYKYMWHRIIKHNTNPNRIDIIYLIKIHLTFIPLLILQILDILAIPLRKL